MIYLQKKKQKKVLKYEKEGKAMNLSRKWLREFVDVDCGDHEFAEAMTLSPKARGKFLSEFSIATAQQLFDRWSKLDKYLLVKYMDGNVKSEHAGVLEYLDGKGGPAHFVDNGNGKQIPDKIQFPGYNEKWKRAVAADNGEVLKVID